MPPDTDTAAEVGVPQIVLRDITKFWNVVSDDNFWYKNADRFIQIKPGKVNVVDVLKDHMFAPTDCTISEMREQELKDM